MDGHILFMIFTLPVSGGFFNLYYEFGKLSVKWVFKVLTNAMYGHYQCYIKCDEV